MPWREKCIMSLRHEFIERTQLEEINISELCREYNISRKTGYKWIRRYRETGVEGIIDRSKQPKTSPKRTKPEIEATIIQKRRNNPTWGGYKIKTVLERVGQEGLPSHSTINCIIKRNDMVNPKESIKHKPFQRFEREQPNELWQMDFKGHFALAAGGSCHPLTILDDHSRFLLGLQACSNETHETVKAQLSNIFRQYGLPEQILMDNGSPWGDDRQSPYTILGAWLLRLGICISHGRPYHPQTQGKVERFHRTLKEDVIKQFTLVDLPDCQSHFDQWRQIYNYERPHQALGMAVPADYYHSSPRIFPERLPPILYDPGAIVRMVDQSGKIYFKSRVFHVGKGFRHNPVALFPKEVEGLFDVYFCHQKIAEISLLRDNS